MPRIKKRLKLTPITENPLHQPIENDLPRCSLCNRRFTENRLVEHQRVCSLSSKSSHSYHYNSQLHRWKGLDYHINAKQNRSQPSRISRKEKHQQLQTMIK